MNSTVKSILILLLGFELGIANTQLQVNAAPTRKQLETAAKLLTEASELNVGNAQRKTKIARARKLTDDRTEMVVVEAELKCGGVKQFTSTGEAYDTPQDCCYSGKVTEAQRLLDIVTNQTDYWSWDEFKVSKIVADESVLNVTVKDMPNNVSETYPIPPCN